MSTDRMSTSTSGLDRERIVAAALDVADRNGLSGLTMRAVARTLNAPVMTLYSYVANKDDLLDAIADAALSEIDTEHADVAWHVALERLFRSFHAALLRHPSLGQLFADRAVSGPNAYRSADAALGHLLRAGFSAAAAVDAFTALITYTIGASLFQTARARRDDAERLRLERLATADRTVLPSLTQLAEHLEVRGTESQFEYGLRHLLAGLRSELPAKGNAAPPWDGSTRR